MTVGADEIKVLQSQNPDSKGAEAGSLERATNSNIKIGTGISNNAKAYLQPLANASDETTYAQPDNNGGTSTLSYGGAATNHHLRSH